MAGKSPFIISVQPWHLVMRTIGLLLVTVALLLSPIILLGLPPATNVRLVSRSSVPKPDSLSFAPSFDEPVAMHIAYSTHYQHDTDEGAQEFARLIPDGGHVVYIDDDTRSPDPRVYTVTLFHQLKCLDIIREQYNAPSQDPSSLVRHCMNYLRQSILCRPNLRIEPARNTGATAFRSYETVCRDWSKVYSEANRNHEAYSRRKG